MNPTRIANLLEPYLGPPDARRLPPDTFDYISTYIDILQHWNARVNLTAIRNQEEIVTRHFGESLFTARHLFPLQENKTGVPHVSPILRDVETSMDRCGDRPMNVSVADIGSGAGFPGIPIKLWAPAIKLTLIESNHKKATFLREIVRTLTLTDVDIQPNRAESLTNIHFHVVTLRAVERFVSILPVAASLIAPGGRLAILIGHAQLPQVQSALPALSWSATIPIPHSQSRVLAIASRT
jgi:16S rRNA (guanine527-N7)-methyltransferase